MEAADLGIYTDDADEMDESPTKSDDVAAAVPKALPIDREGGPMVDERADVTATRS